ncbi:hypothetical protein [Lysobacter sp. Root916]|uniref:hypothetical protein n=1 Tax=Lysobacter sp. Root916 TaxID=1736606 RepID=UPI0012F961CC|nr:hypothetical protein [Lysobacter sp. Root916]
MKTPMKKAALALALLLPAGLMFAIAAPRALGALRGETRAVAQAGSAAAAASVIEAPTRQAGERLLQLWAPHVQQVYGTPPQAWARAMRPTLARLSERDLRRAAAMPSFDAMMAALTPQPALDIPAPSAWDARKAGAAALLETTSAQLVYNMLSPCRLSDTRLNGARLVATGQLHLKTAGADLSAQGGHPAGCAIPVDARAVVVNVVAVNPAQAGYLTVFPYGTQLPVASSLNYRATDIAGNEIIAKQGADPAQPSLSVFSSAATDLVVDVVGYFGDAPKVGMACEQVVQVYDMEPSRYGSKGAQCPYLTPDSGSRGTAMGGGCRWLENAAGDPEPGQVNGRPSRDTYYCDADNSGRQVTRSFEVTATCCWVASQ